MDLDISKHPMLLFNHSYHHAICRAWRFQNILCCCLTYSPAFHPPLLLISKHPMLLFNLKEAEKQVQQQLFQNILCCCLTGSTLVAIADATIFQNILCCCLTHHFKPFLKCIFFLMLVLYTISLKITSNFCYIIYNY